MGHPAVEVHILARALLSVQVQNAMLITQHREIIGRLDVLEGKANSTMGDSPDRLAELREARELADLRALLPALRALIDEREPARA